MPAKPRFVVIITAQGPELPAAGAIFEESFPQFAVGLYPMERGRPRLYRPVNVKTKNSKDTYEK
jgi:hypothetical protein